MYSMSVSQQLAVQLVLAARDGSFSGGEIVRIWFDRRRQLVALRSRNWSRADEERRRERLDDDYDYFEPSIRFVRIPTSNEYKTCCSANYDWQLVMSDVRRLVGVLSGDWFDSSDVWNYNVLCKGF